MALVLNEAPLTKATQAYVIKNPNQVTNGFTINDDYMAAETLKLRDQEQIAELKNYVKNFDMTSINTQDLKKIGRALYENDIINIHAYRMFIEGNLAFDEKGKQTATHVEFNAIALFSERLQDYNDFLKKHPENATKENLEWRQGMIAANHAVGALSYFANSVRSDLSIHEKA
ncbi:hypothetical protein DYL59_18650 [Pseudomonas kairouanensis]|uniref:Uncharacterized protein n=1 Tax=Pseudomonas kairouanensis TaxID=2293832 RepID=A0A4Z0ALT1_9PSED|nr:hypothetical protein [Pseudomonas kairouanensis]TFY87377.1 hypothetical protein DYL59_18650 [Pseudomonas kairouanensis]